ncbi:MAG TPA: XRE family transcriptional regulator [Anaerolineae bacterium]|nr:XRE family transcriptional regulator [Anaerolineae bacterium]HXV96987.1 XRE family transcriptional regulator [Anaerolineae bacterium]
MNIGERIHRQRKKLGLSLRELGTRTDLTAGFLSQLENDQLSPSLNSLQAIATALQVPMFYFLEGVHRPSSVIRSGERRQLYFPDSHMGYDLLAPELTRQMLPLLIRMEPGARRVAMPLAKPTEQWFFVLQGRLEIKIGDDIHLLEQGDSIYADGDLLREFAAAGEEELQIICCMTPPAL